MTPFVGAAQGSAEKGFLSSTAGMVTRLHDFGSSTVVVNIQDLHCHTEVQKNISRILGTLVERYDLKKVYVEGASGDIDTSWLGRVKDAGLKKEISETLLRQGKLTGTEYYSIMNNKPLLLKGVENEQIHRSNIVRLSKILDKQEYFEGVIKKFERDMSSLETRYFSSRTKRFNRIAGQYRAGKIAPQKYYALLQKYVDHIRAHPQEYATVLPAIMNDYPNISAYLQLEAIGKRLHYRSAARQMSLLVQELKSRLSWREYNAIQQKTDNFSNPDQYGNLVPYIREYSRGAENRFVDLAMLISFTEQRQRINPLDLIREERALSEAIRFTIPRNAAERDVSFLVDSFGYLKDYLLNRISAEDYAYFVERFDTFKATWARYDSLNQLETVSAEFALLHDYYRANDDRTGVFLRTIFPGNTRGEDARRAARSGDTTGTAALSPEALLSNAREIVIVVTGGFHTEGLEKLLGDRKISSLVVTPAVHEDTRTANAIYRGLAKEQGKRFESSALQLALESAGNDHVLALAGALLAGHDIADIPRAARELGITVTLDEARHMLTVSNGTVGYQVPLPQKETWRQSVRNAIAQLSRDEEKILLGVVLSVEPIRDLVELAYANRSGVEPQAAAKADSKRLRFLLPLNALTRDVLVRVKTMSISFLKASESTALGYWLAKALFPADTDRQQKWGRRTLPVEAAVLMYVALLPPVAGVSVLVGGFIVQQALKTVGTLRAPGSSSLAQFLTSTTAELARYLAVVVPLGLTGVYYALNPLDIFTVFPMIGGISLFPAILIASSVSFVAYNLSRLGSLRWSSPSAAVMGSLTGFLLPLVMGGIGVITIPVMAWGLAGAIVFAFTMSVVAPLSRHDWKSMNLADWGRAGKRGLSSFLVLLAVIVPLNLSATVPGYAVTPSLATIAQMVSGNTSGYDAAILSAGIDQLNALAESLRTFDMISSNTALGPVNRLVRDSLSRIPQDPVRRAEIADTIHFNSDAQKRIFITHGVLVVGGYGTDVVYMEKLLHMLPASHLNTPLIFLTPMEDEKGTTTTSGMILWGAFIVIKSGDSPFSGAHEIGHSISLPAAFKRLNELSGKDQDNFERTYGMRNKYEDWATIYEAWVKNSGNLADHMKVSPLLTAKVKEVARQFVTVQDGKTYLRVYQGNTFSDVPFTGDIANADLSALAAQVTPETLESQLISKINSSDKAGALQLAEKYLETASSRQFLDLLLSVYTISPDAAVTIYQGLSEKNLHAVPNTMTFDYMETTVDSWEDLALLGNLNPARFGKIFFSDLAKAERLMKSFPPANMHLLQSIGGMTFAYQYIESLYASDPAAAESLVTSFPELLSYVFLPESLDVGLNSPQMQCAEWLLFSRKMDWNKSDTLKIMRDSLDSPGNNAYSIIDSMVVDYAARLSSSDRDVFLAKVAKQTYVKDMSGQQLADAARSILSIDEVFSRGQYDQAAQLLHSLLSQQDSPARSLAVSFLREADIQQAIWAMARTHPAHALNMLVASRVDMRFLVEEKELAKTMLNADVALSAQLFGNNMSRQGMQNIRVLLQIDAPLFQAMDESTRATIEEKHSKFIGSIIMNKNPDEVPFVVDLIRAIGPDAAADSMVEYVHGQKGFNRPNVERDERLAGYMHSYREYTQLLPASEQEYYRRILDQVEDSLRGGIVTAPMATMQANKKKALRWAEKGVSPFGIAVRLALVEAIPRMVAPERWFVAEHTKQDKEAARAVVRAGNMGGVAAGVVSMVAVSTVLPALAVLSPLAWILPLMLSGAGGWFAGSFIVGGVRQVILDFGVYSQLAIARLGEKSLSILKDDDAPATDVVTINDDLSTNMYMRLLSAS